VALRTPAATRKLGAILGQLAEPGELLELQGPLGAGKTCLVQGVARGLGVREAVTSPTFTLINQYSVPPKRRKSGTALTPAYLYHVDLYRLSSAEELSELGLWEVAAAGGVMAVEWLSRFPEALPPDRLLLQLAYGPGRGRSLTVHAGGERSRLRLRELSFRLQSDRAFS
jgi:tRNA threonylcarbamoyladenosine biosynthesis protein TsaE